MTPEEIKNTLMAGMPNDFKVCGIPKQELLNLCDSALRLAAIEGAEDEDFDSCLSEIDNGQEGAFFAKIPVIDVDRLRLMFKSRNQVIADLRAKLGEAEQRIEFYEELVNNLRESEVGGG